jgi:hypothetical protein
MVNGGVAGRTPEGSKVARNLEVISVLAGCGERSLRYSRAAARVVNQWYPQRQVGSGARCVGSDQQTAGGRTGPER